MLPWHHHFNLRDVVGEDPPTCYPYFTHIRNLFFLILSALSPGAFQIFSIPYSNGGTSLRDLVWSINPLVPHLMVASEHQVAPLQSIWLQDGSLTLETTFIQLPASSSWKAIPLPSTPLWGVYSVRHKKCAVPEKHTVFCICCRFSKYHTILLKLCRIMHWHQVSWKKNSRSL